MLNLERMEISGFKSFSDRIEVVFPDGITAVVGPNGCGKSNLGDAINWVLGEQSPKVLRGRQMADVIFNGTHGRKPLGMAEVSRHFRGSEGLPHNEQGNVVITRRLFRSGESDYRINGARVRLKDIQELLRRARVGTKSYATIEQGKIDQVLNARPKDRRLLIEDAAGIAGYKHKRRLTELKLEATQANLLRVNDIVIEVRRQINSLKRQASKARRYRRLREELREHEQLRFALRTRETDAELTRWREVETEARDHESGASGELGRLEVEVLDRRSALDEANRSHRETAERLHALEIEADREESRIRGCRERIADSEQAGERHRAEAAELAARQGNLDTGRIEHAAEVERGRVQLEQANRSFEERQAALEAEEEQLRQKRAQLEEIRERQFGAMHRTAELRNRLGGIEGALERNAQQQARLVAEQSSASEESQRLDSESSALAAVAAGQRERVEELRAELARAEAALHAARQAQNAGQEALTEGREREQSALARLSTLEDVATRFAGVSDGVRMLLSADSPAGVQPRGVVADFIEARSDTEAAAEGYLKTLLPTVIVSEDEDVARAADYLREQGAGRTSIICSSQPAGALAVGSPQNGKANLPDHILADQRVLGRLRERLNLKTSANGVLRDRIGDAVLVDSLRSALDLHRDYPGADYLTPRGDVVYASGLVAVGGEERAEQGLLAHNRRMHEAEAEATEAAQRSAELQREAQQARNEVARLEAELRERREAAEAGGRRGIELEHETRRSDDDRERSRRRAQVLAEELSNLDEEAARLRVALGEAAAEVEQAQAATSKLEEDLRARALEVEQDEQRLKQCSDEVAGLRADRAARRQAQEALEREAARLDEVVAELAGRITALHDSSRREAERALEAQGQIETSEAALLEHLEERERLSAQAEELDRRVAGLQNEVADGEKKLREVRTGLESLREQTREAELERARAEADRKHLDELCLHELGVSAAEALAAAAEGLDEVDAGSLDERIDTVRQKIDRLGPVNMAAIEEFSELEERYAFLTTQQQDLDKAMDSLHETIRRINRQSRDKFREAFDAVRKNYQEIFSVLFHGGHADLRLEEGEDVLECGIEIMAQPPGKRLTNVQLLSGGEKAMSAIALLFAVFRYQPSPFCLLDEVDAALDDVNVGRFARMVREYARQTQFIIVTHNKLTMEASDLLYGVTMEEPGVSRLVSLQLK